MQEMLGKIYSLLLYQGMFDDPVGQLFLELIQHPPNTFCWNRSYGKWFKQLAQINSSWQDFLVEKILLDENPFSEKVQSDSLAELPEDLLRATQRDLSILEEVYYFDIGAAIPWGIANRQGFFDGYSSWEKAVPKLAEHYRKYGTGIFATYKAFRWEESKLLGIAFADPIKPQEIVGYEHQKETLMKNTQFLLAGYPALHVLLYGSRGSGKSSLVKGLLNEYGNQGLRLIEVPKSQLISLPLILEQVRGKQQKFIIFVDDLSFEEDDESFKALKVVLEGSLTAKAKNVVVYATSNRRHLVREFFEERPRPGDGEEVHAWDTVQEKLSFGDRFGITLTFEPANQDTYLKIVHHLALQANITIDRDELEFRAKQWATRHNGRSGRTARQFVDNLMAEYAYSSGGR